MAYERDVYCEFEFLKKFGDSHPMRRTIAYKVHEAIDEFIFCKSRLKLNIDKTTFATKLEEQELNPGDFLFDFSDAYAMGRLAAPIRFYGTDEFNHPFKSADDIITNHPEERLTHVFLVDKEEKQCNTYRRQCGAVVLSQSCYTRDINTGDINIEKFKYLFEDSGKHKSQGEPVRWVDIFHKKLKLSDSNAMVIIDNYICSKGFPNIRGVLDALLPGTKEKCLLKDIFHLTIITSSVVNSIKDTYDEIIKIIKDIRPKLKIKFDIFINKTSTYQAKENHDRYILTNNVIITSGYGFGLLYKDKKDEKIKTSGELNIMIAHPGIQNFSKRTDEAYVGKLSEVYQQIFEKSNLIHYPTGEDCTNRLILSMAELVAKANDTKSCK